MPTWVFYMIAVCIAAFLIGYIAAYIMDTWNER